MDNSASSSTPTLISAKDLTLGYGNTIVQNDLCFSIKKGSIFAIMGGSGCGKSTLMRSMVGLLKPKKGSLFIESKNYWEQTEEERVRTNHRFGVLFQSGALWSSMSVGENVALPMHMFTDYSQHTIQKLVELKLGLVGLEQAINLYPSEISGGMRKRAGLARAIALDPDILFFDEPSSGLDPISSARLDELILTLRNGLGATVIMVSHELESLYKIADDGIFLDATSKSAVAQGSPRYLRDHSTVPEVVAFMNRSTKISPSQKTETK